MVVENTLAMASIWNNAEDLRKSGKYEQALPIFLDSFMANSDEGSLWRAIHCYRKLGQFELALELIEANKAMLATSVALKSQFCWLKYDAVIDKNKKSGNWDAVLKCSEEILEIVTDVNDLLFKLALFAGIDAAKKMDEPQKVLELTEMVGPEKFPAEGELFNGKKLLSYRERWFYARLGALFDVQLYEECRSLSLEAVRQYPRRLEFSRRGALCKMMLGCNGEAEEELLAISKTRGCPWYITADLAKLRFNTGSFHSALDSAYEAALMPGELQSKVNLFSLIARIQLVLGDSESAKNHTILACSIRKHLNWKFNQETVQLASRFGIDDNLPLPHIAKKACEEEWRKQNKNMPANNVPSEKVDDGKLIATSLQGTITSIVEGRPFTFIRRADNGQNVYAKLSDIPAELQANGTELEFDLVESFDKLKNKKSVRATNVRNIVEAKIA